MSHPHSALIVPVWLLRLRLLELLRLFITKFFPVQLWITAAVLCWFWWPLWLWQTHTDKYIVLSVCRCQRRMLWKPAPSGGCDEIIINVLVLMMVHQNIFFIYNRKDKCLFLMIFYVNCSFCGLQIKYMIIYFGIIYTKNLWKNML